MCLKSCNWLCMCRKRDCVQPASLPTLPYYCVRWAVVWPSTHQDQPGLCVCCALLWHALSGLMYDISCCFCVQTDTRFLLVNDPH